MTLLQESIRLCAERGECFWGSLIVKAHRGGIIYLDENCVLIADRESPDTVFVWWAVGRGYLSKLVELAPPGTRWLKWQRGLRLADRAEVGQFDFRRVQRLAALTRHELPR